MGLVDLSFRERVREREKEKERRSQFAFNRFEENSRERVKKKEKYFRSSSLFLALRSSLYWQHPPAHSPMQKSQNSSQNVHGNYRDGREMKRVVLLLSFFFFFFSFCLQTNYETGNARYAQLIGLPISLSVYWFCRRTTDESKESRREEACVRSEENEGKIDLDVSWA